MIVPQTKALVRLQAVSRLNFYSTSGRCAIGACAFVTVLGLRIFMSRLDSKR